MLFCGSADSSELLDGFGLFLDAERVVEFVEKAAERDAQGQLDQLSLAEMRFKSGEQRVGNAVRPLPRRDRVCDDELVSVVEFRVIAVFENPFDGIRQPVRRRPLRRLRRPETGCGARRNNHIR